MTQVREIIRNEIENCGVISFARFMELALYCPDCGFYEQEPDTIGRRGHYYTSVSTGGLFGELLAMQFAEWLAELHAGSPVRIIEAGSHDGQLAADILDWFRTWRPALYDRIEYWIVEPSARRRTWQLRTLGRFGTRVRWVDSLESVRGELVGVIFSNEFLDSLPVHRFGWDMQNREWFEWGVTVSEDKFIWARIRKPGCKPGLPVELPTELLNALPDGYVVETCPAAERWWNSAAHALAAGKLVAIDYGLSRHELLNPARTNGTVRAYYRHQFSDDVLARPGEQDITAHVDFTALQIAGESAGLTTVGLFTQGQFLRSIAERALNAGLSLGHWSDAQKRQFKTLVHPEHLGALFRVLVQSRPC